MCGQQNGVAKLVKFGNELPQGLAQLNVNTSSGFVQHNHRWLMHQGLCHQHATLHTTRELAHVVVGFVAEA